MTFSLPVFPCLCKSSVLFTLHTSALSFSFLLSLLFPSFSPSTSLIFSSLFQSFVFPSLHIFLYIFSFIFHLCLFLSFYSYAEYFPLFFLSFLPLCFSLAMIPSLFSLYISLLSFSFSFIFFTSNFPPLSFLFTIEISHFLILLLFLTSPLFIFSPHRFNLAFNLSMLDE